MHSLPIFPQKCRVDVVMVGAPHPSADRVCAAAFVVCAFVVAVALAAVAFSADASSAAGDVDVDGADAPRCGSRDTTRMASSPESSEFCWPTLTMTADRHSIRHARVHVCVAFAVRIFASAVAGKSSSSARIWWRARRA